ncbi:unnamed protein product, partial [Vitis vinifera]
MPTTNLDLLVNPSDSYIECSSELHMALILATSNGSSPAPVANPETNRRTANYQPSIWGNTFIVSHTPEDEITLAHKEQQLEDLKGEVRRELMAAASNPSKQLT